MRFLKVAGISAVVLLCLFIMFGVISIVMPWVIERLGFLWVGILLLISMVIIIVSIVNKAVKR